jgi:hypothetical protein
MWYYQRGATMDFIEQLETLANRIFKQRDMIKTEEATKMAFVVPFISALGYDVFDPTEVIPEFVADVGMKQGEKVDYAILKDDKVIMLIECKKCGADLEDASSLQLFRYFFSTAKTRVGILTDGVIYRFYTDLEEPNKMDQKPFMEFDMLDIQEPLVLSLKRFTKPAFDLNKVLIDASDLKYTKEIKRIMAEQLDAPSEDFVQFVLSHVYTGLRRTKAVREQFIDITKRALNQFFNEQINKRLIPAHPKEPSSEDTGEKSKEPTTAWSSSELANYLNESTPAQKALLAILARAPANEWVWRKQIIADMPALLTQMGVSDKYKAVSGYTIVGAMSGMTMRRKPIRKDSIIKTEQYGQKIALIEQYIPQIKQWLISQSLA